MPPAQRSHVKKGPYGPNIVRAWFDTVFRYLLHGLEVERRLLERHDWTWQFRPPGLKSLGAVRQHVMPEASQNLDQFLGFHPEMARLAEKHDACVDELAEQCGAYHDALVRSPKLRGLFQQITAECGSTLGEEVSRYFGAYADPEDFLAVLAANIINSVGEEPSYYATAKLWNHYRTDLLHLRLVPAIRPRYEATTLAGQELAHAVDSLLDNLRQVQSALSLTYDVPFVQEVSVPG